MSLGYLWDFDSINLDAGIDRFVFSNQDLVKGNMCLLFKLHPQWINGLRLGYEPLSVDLSMLVDNSTYQMNLSDVFFKPGIFCYFFPSIHQLIAFEIYLANIKASALISPENLSFDSNLNRLVFGASWQGRLMGYPVKLGSEIEMWSGQIDVQHTNDELSKDIYKIDPSLDFLHLITEFPTIFDSKLLLSWNQLNIAGNLDHYKVLILKRLEGTYNSPIRSIQYMQIKLNKEWHLTSFLETEISISQLIPIAIQYADAPNTTELISDNGNAAGSNGYGGLELAFQCKYQYDISE